MRAIEAQPYPDTFSSRALPVMAMRQQGLALTNPIRFPMSQIPAMPVPPHGALEPLRAMEEYLPEEWQRYMEAKEAVEAQQKKMRVPPGGNRWPETDPRYIAPINASRRTALRHRRNDLKSTCRELSGALLRNLQSGLLRAYAEPTFLDGQYLCIPVALWQQLTTIRIHDGALIGLRPEPVRLLICHTDQGVKNLPGDPEDRQQLHAYFSIRNSEHANF